MIGFIKIEIVSNNNKIIYNEEFDISKIKKNINVNFSIDICYKNIEFRVFIEKETFITIKELQFISL
jgi:hypothetical protein